VNEVWETHAKVALSKEKPVFFECFVAKKAIEIKEIILSCLREAAGHGSPPSPFYTNICECLNSVLHEKVKYKKSEWHKFNEAIARACKAKLSDHRVSCD